MSAFWIVGVMVEIGVPKLLVSGWLEVRCTWEAFYIRSGYRAKKSGVLVTTFIDSQCKILKLSTHYMSFDWMLLRSWEWLLPCVVSGCKTYIYKPWLA